MATATMLMIVVVLTLGFAFQGSCWDTSDRYQNTANWWVSFNKKGASRCRDRFLMKGLWRSACDKLFCLEEAHCARSSRVYAVGSVLKANWWRCLDKGHGGWCSCAAGSYLTGFYRSSGQNLHNLEEGYCRRVPRSQRWGSCYDENVYSRFDKKGLSKCQRSGYYMVGLWKTRNCNGLHCIERFKCCRPGYSSHGHHHHGHSHGHSHGHVQVRQRWYQSTANWWVSFNKQGASQCQDKYLMRGLWRSACDKLYCLEEARCSRSNLFYAVGPVLKANWWTCLDKGHGGWCSCAAGSYLTGFYRTSGQNLHNLEVGYCRRVSHSRSWGTCYEENVYSRFDKKGVSQCQRTGYFMVAVWKTRNCNGLHCLEKFKCCRPGYSSHGHGHGHGSSSCSRGSSGVVPQ